MTTKPTLPFLEYTEAFTASAAEETVIFPVSLVELQARALRYRANRMLEVRSQAPRQTNASTSPSQRQKRLLSIIDVALAIVDEEADDGLLPTSRRTE